MFGRSMPIWLDLEETECLCGRSESQNELERCRNGAVQLLSIHHGISPGMSKVLSDPHGSPARQNVLTRRLRESMSGLCHNAASLELGLELWEESRFRDGVPPQVGNMSEPASTAPSYETHTREAWREW